MEGLMQWWNISFVEVALMPRNRAFEGIWADTAVDQAGKSA